MGALSGLDQSSCYQRLQHASALPRVRSSQRCAFIANITPVVAVVAPAIAMNIFGKRYVDSKTSKTPGLVFMKATFLKASK